MDDRLAEALAPVLEDVARTCALPASIVDEPWSDLGPSAMLMSPDGSGTGIFVVLAEDEASQVVRVAEQVQDWAVEELWARGLPAVWPHCDLHPDTHPLQATQNGLGQPAWACPVEGWVQGRIGRLAPSG